MNQMSPAPRRPLVVFDDADFVEDRETANDGISASLLSIHADATLRHLEHVRHFQDCDNAFQNMISRALSYDVLSDPEARDRQSQAARSDDPEYQDLPPEFEERIDFASCPWILDHQPNFVVANVPMAHVIDLMLRYAISQSNGRRPVSISNLRIFRWLTVDDAIILKPKSIFISGTEMEIDLTAKFANNCEFISVAKGVVYFAKSALLPEKIEDEILLEEEFASDLYGHGRLFHGASLRCVVAVRRGRVGIVADIDASDLGYPQGYANVGLIDGMFQAAACWSDAKPERPIFPLVIENFEIFGDIPRDGLCECRARPELRDETGSDGSRLAFEIQLWSEGELRIAIKILYVALDLRAGFSLINAHRRFLSSGVVETGFGIGSTISGETSVSMADIADADRIAGTVAGIYGCPTLSGLALMRTVAVKQHVSASIGAHPWTIDVEDDVAVCRSLPFARFQVSIFESSRGVSVRSVSVPETAFSDRRTSI